METKLSSAVLEKNGILKRMTEVGMGERNARKEMSFAVQLCNQSPTLQKCTLESVMAAVVNVANVGLTLNPAAKQAYIVPRYNKQINGFEAILEPGYGGLIHLAIKAGGITSIMCEVVYENDEIIFEPTNQRNPVTHRPAWKDRGNIIGVYGVATLPNGDRQAERLLLEEIHIIRERSDSYRAFKDGKVKSCTWDSDFSEMARKTALKRLLKYLPKTSGPSQAILDHAIELDNYDYSAEAWQLERIEYLSRVLEEKESRLLDSELRVGITRQRANDIIRNLETRFPGDDPRFGDTHRPATAARKAIAGRMEDETA